MAWRDLAQRFVTRRRAAFWIVGLTLILNAWFDYRLIVGNPRELKAQVTRQIAQLLPQYEATFDDQRTQINWLQGRLTLRDLVVHEKDDPEKVLFKIPRLDVSRSGLGTFVVKAFQPEMRLEIDREGKLRGFPEGKGQPPTSILWDLQIEVVDGRVTVINDFQGMNDKVYLGSISTDPERPLRLERDLSLRGALSLYAGALVPGGERRLEGIPPDLARQGLAARDLVQELKVELAREAQGGVKLEASGFVQVSRTLRSLIPELFQTKVWDELNPTAGQIGLLARVSVPPGDKGARIDVSLAPRRVQIRPKGFPIDLRGIGGGGNRGRFEISVNVPPSGPPAVLNVAWEGVEGFVGSPSLVPGRARPAWGRVKSKGSVFPGTGIEPLTMHIYIDVFELPLSDELVAAFPPDIRAVYKQFSPQGVVPLAHVQLFKGAFEDDRVVLRDGSRLRGKIPPGAEKALEDEQGREHRDAKGRISPLRPLRFRTQYGEELTLTPDRVQEVIRADKPQISVKVPELGGGLQATFVGEKRADGTTNGVPIPLRNLRGQFRLSEDANVEIDARGDLDVGGQARVRARVLHGELIYVEVNASKVPVTPKVVSLLPGRSRTMLLPFRLAGGEVDARVIVKKEGPDQEVVPEVYATLRGVGARPELVPLALKASGSLKVLPRLDALGELKRIELETDLLASAPGVKGLRVRGPLVLPARQPKEGVRFDADLRFEASEVAVRSLEKVKPIRGVLAELNLKGAVRKVRGRLRGPRILDVRGQGAELAAELKAFPLPVGIESFDLSLKERDLTLRACAGRRGKGRFQITSGKARLPAEGQDEAPLDLDLALSLQEFPLDAPLLAAVPKALREGLSPLRPRAAVSGGLAFSLREGVAPVVSADVRLAKGTIDLHRLDPEGKLRYLAKLGKEEAFAGQSPQRVRDLKGRLQLDSRRLRMSGFTGTWLKKVPLSIEGELGLDLRPKATSTLQDFRVQARLLGLELDPVRQRLAGPDAQEVFQRFDVRGKLDLELEVARKAAAKPVGLTILARPRGALCWVRKPVLLPVVDLTGEVKVVDGDPVLVKLQGKLDHPTKVKGVEQPAPRVEVYRDAARERRFPGGGRAGKVYQVRVRDLVRFQDGQRRAAFEGGFKQSWKARLNELDPRGGLDLSAWVFQPNDARAPMHWVAEMTLRRFAFQLGGSGGQRGALDFADLVGRVQVRGQLAEDKIGTCRGRFALKRLDLFKQTLRDVRAPFRVDSKGVLTLGRRLRPLRARLYEGLFRGLMTYDFPQGKYAADLQLGAGEDEPGTLRSLMQELNELKSQEELRAWKGPERPYRGELACSLSFGGGGKDARGRELPFRGRGRFTLSRSNLMDDPRLRALQSAVLTSRLFGDLGKTARSFPNMELDFSFGSKVMKLRRLRLWGGSLEIRGERGTLQLSGEKKGYIDVPLALTTVDGWAHRVLSNIPGVGYNFRGKLQDGPAISTAGFNAEVFRRLVTVFKAKRDEE